jgi:tetratricopeptide (TPR) repeat protein
VEGRAEDAALALAYAGLARDRQGKDGGAQIARAVSLDRQNAQVRYLEGLHWRQVGNYQASLSALVQATALDPENPALYAELASAYRLLGDLDAAERWYMQAVSVSNGDPRWQTVLDAFRAERGALLEQLGLTDEPIPDATDAVLPP